MTHDNAANFLDNLANNYEAPAFQKNVKVIAVNVESEKLVSYDVVGGKKRISGKVTPFQYPPKSNGSSAPIMAQSRPSVEKLDAKSFLDALRDAGLRAGKRDHNLIQVDKQKAIQQYVGYNYGQPFGTQLDNAERKAKIALKPVGHIAAPPVSKTVEGYVAGSPDLASKNKADLEGRLAMAIESHEIIWLLAKTRTIVIRFVRMHFFMRGWKRNGLWF